MPWSWSYQSQAGHTADASPAFPTQADAESWIGETWRDLLSHGVDAVTLLEDDRVVYADMSLRPAE